MCGAPTTEGIRGKLSTKVTLTVTSLDSYRRLVLFWTKMEKFQPSSCFGFKALLGMDGLGEVKSRQRLDTVNTTFPITG